MGSNGEAGLLLPKADLTAWDFTSVPMAPVTTGTLKVTPRQHASHLQKSV